VRSLSSLARSLGLVLLVGLAVTIAIVLLMSGLWWLLAGFLAMLWAYGFIFSHAYILANDGIGPRSARDRDPPNP
jgi:membrane protein implicated in regulation of membrane protease activity